MRGHGSRVGVDLRRRDFLRLGAVAAVALPMGCSAARRIARPATASGEIQTPVALGAHHFAILVALTEGLYPGDERRPAGVALGVPQRVDEELYFAPEHVREQIELALDVLEWGGWLAGGFSRFTGLEPAERVARVQRYLGHGFDSYRQVGVGLTQVVKAFYYADERSWAAIGYDGPLVPAKAPDSSAHYAAVLAQARAAEEGEG